jgi:NitT/TauT family transport system substrate-binding protein
MGRTTTLRRAGAVLAMLLAGLLAVSACSSSGGGSGSGSGGQSVALRLDFVHTGKDAIWTYGIEKGFFSKQGIDLKIEDGKGSATTAQTVSNNSDKFGLVDGGTWLTAASKGLSGKAVMSVFDGGSFAVLSPAKSPITDFAQLAGKKVAITAGDGPSTLLPAVLQKAGVDKSKITEVNMQAGPKLTALATGRVDAVATTVLVQATLQATGTETKALLYSSAGINTPGWYLVAAPDELKSHSDLVQKFVTATQQSIDATLADPQAAVDSFVKKYPEYDKTRAKNELDLVLPLVKTDEAKGHPTGWISPDAATSALALLKQYGSVQGDQPATAFISDAFVK